MFKYRKYTFMPRFSFQCCSRSIAIEKNKARGGTQIHSRTNKSTLCPTQMHIEILDDHSVSANFRKGKIHRLSNSDSSGFRGSVRLRDGDMSLREPLGCWLLPSFFSFLPKLLMELLRETRIDFISVEANRFIL